MPVSTYAYDFEVDGIYYGINDDGTSVYVTYKDRNYTSYTGSVEIPVKVTYNGTTYGVTAIGLNAFYKCAELTDVKLPETITFIDEFGFAYCDKLASITIPEAVTTIGWGAFRGCSTLTQVVIPNSVTHIGEYSFNNCTSLTSVTIGTSVNEIGYGAFNNTPWLDNQPDGPIYAGKVFYCYKGTMPENYSITLNEGTLGIAGEAFYDETNLVGISIPETVSAIMSYAFYGCNGLTSITLPNSLRHIGSNAFTDCSGLTSIVVPDAVTEIPYGVFYGCTNLASITISDNVTYVGNTTFSDTAWLNNLPDGPAYINKVLYTYKGTMPENYALTIKEGTTVTADLALEGQTNLVSVSIPNTVTNLGYSTFDNTGLTSVSVPGSVKVITGYAFANCSKLASATIGNDVKLIEWRAFKSCTNLMSFTCNTPTPPVVEFDNGSLEDAFTDLPTECVLYVPEKSIEAYRTADGWSRFSLVSEIPQGCVDAIGSDAITITATAGAIRIGGAQGAVAEVYTPGGALLYRGTESTIAMPRGLYIVKVAGRTAKVVI